jgi:hypothetical protein
VDGSFTKLVWATVAMQRNSLELDLLKNGKVFVSLLSDYNTMSDSEALILLQDCNGTIVDGRIASILHQLQVLA